MALQPPSALLYGRSHPYRQKQASYSVCISGRVSIRQGMVGRCVCDDAERAMLSRPNQITTHALCSVQLCTCPHAHAHACMTRMQEQVHPYVSKAWAPCASSSSTSCLATWPCMGSSATLTARCNGGLPSQARSAFDPAFSSSSAHCTWPAWVHMGHGQLDVPVARHACCHANCMEFTPACTARAPQVPSKQRS